MKKYLACTLLAIALTLNAEAVFFDPDPDDEPPPAASVPDNGSTAVLLGLGVVAIAAFHRKKATA